MHIEKYNPRKVQVWLNCTYGFSVDRVPGRTGLWGDGCGLAADPQRPAFDLFADRYSSLPARADRQSDRTVPFHPGRRVEAAGYYPRRRYILYTLLGPDRRQP